MGKTPFGKEFKKKYFTNEDPNLRNVNHGSFGVSPDLILNKYCEIFTKTRESFDQYLRYEFREKYISNLKLLAAPDLLDCDYRNLVIADSGTAGVNTILRSFPFKAGDKIVVTSTTYNSCAKAVSFLEKRIGIVPVVINLTYPLTQDEIAKKFEHTLSLEGPVKLALIDAVSSLPGCRLPFEKLVKLCKQYGTVSLVDSSHGIGLIPNLSISSFEPDFFVSNLHKWWYIPKSCSVLYVSAKYHGVIEPQSVSYIYSHDKDYIKTDEEINSRSDSERLQLIDKFWFSGYQNQPNILLIEDVKKFRNEVCGGELEIAKYCNALAHKIGETIWKDDDNKFPADKESVTSMVNIRVPYEKWIGPEYELVTVAKWLGEITKEISRKHHTFVSMFKHDDKVWVRFSTQIYNELEDFEYASNAIEVVFKKFFTKSNISKYESAPKSGNIFEVVTGLDELKV